MPTPPHPDLLPATEPGVAEVLGKFSAHLDEAVAKGSHVLAWSLAVTNRGQDENAPRWTMMRRFLELLDGTSAHVLRGSAESARVTLRSLFEGALSILYLLEADHTRRALAYTLVLEHAEIKALETLDPSTPVGASVAPFLKADRFTANLPAHASAASVAAIRAGFTGATYGPIEQEYERLRQSAGRSPAWYQLFGGPPTVIELARRLKLGGMYELLYRPLSGGTHSSDATKRALSFDAHGAASLLQLRHPADAQWVTFVSMSLALHVLRAYVAFYNPERSAEFEDWYLTIRAPYQRLAGDAIIRFQ